MKVVICLWWACYIIIALVVQQHVPGLDALAPGLLLALQQGKRMQLYILFILFTLIQEGTGSLPFGTSVLWYAGHIVLFFLSGKLFVADNLLFVALLAVSLGVYKICLLWLMCVSTNVTFDYILIFRESVVQTISTPVLWGLAYMLRPKAMRYGY